MASPDDRDIDKLINEGRLRLACSEPAFVKCYTCGFESERSFLRCPGCNSETDIKITCKSCKGIILNSGQRDCLSVEQFKVHSIIPFLGKKSASNPKLPGLPPKNTSYNKQNKSASVYISAPEIDLFEPEINLIEIDNVDDLGSESKQADSFSGKSRVIKSDKPKFNIFYLFGNANIYTSLGTILCCLMGVGFFPDASFGLFANIALNIFGVFLGFLILYKRMFYLCIFFVFIQAYSVNCCFFYGLILACLNLLFLVINAKEFES